MNPHLFDGRYTLCSIVEQKQHKNIDNNKGIGPEVFILRWNALRSPATAACEGFPLHTYLSEESNGDTSVHIKPTLHRRSVHRDSFLLRWS